MSKPTAGESYTVVSGDSIRKISRKAYGYDRANDIVDANSALLNGRGTSLEGLPYIYAGDILFLPGKARAMATTIGAGSDDEIAIRLDGKVFQGWIASNITRNINKIADGFTFSLPYDYTDTDLRDRTRPYSYKTADLFIGGELYVSAQCIKWATAMSTNDTIKTIDARTKAGHTVECMAQKSALEFSNLTLSGIATEVMKPYGDNLAPVFLDGDSDRFTKVRKEITDTDFNFLHGLAQQKGFMITSSTDGQMAFIRANIDGKPVFRFVEGDSAILNISFVGDGQKRFSSFQAITESAGTPGPTSMLPDSSIPVYRPFVFSADDSETGNLETAIKWKRAKSLADSTTLSVTVIGWRNEYNDLWQENMKGTVLAPSIDILTESEYIISGVSLSKSENGGNVAALSLVLPQSYSLDFPDSFPWEG